MKSKIVLLNLIFLCVLISLIEKTTALGQDQPTHKWVSEYRDVFPPALPGTKDEQDEINFLKGLGSRQKKNWKGQLNNFRKNKKEAKEVARRIEEEKRRREEEKQKMLAEIDEIRRKGPDYKKLDMNRKDKPCGSRRDVHTCFYNDGPQKWDCDWKDGLCYHKKCFQNNSPETCERCGPDWKFIFAGVQSGCKPKCTNDYNKKTGRWECKPNW